MRPLASVARAVSCLTTILLWVCVTLPQPISCEEIRELAKNEEVKQPSPTFSMSHFTNKQNLLIRTYSARIPDAKASIVLVHGNCCHFRSEFAAYNMKWHMENLGIGTPSVQDVIDRELRAVYPLGASVKSKDPNASFPDYSCLDGRNMFDISPRFIYEGSFIEKLNQLGYNVYGLDHQSNGLSQSLKDRRNFFLSLEDLVDDVIQFIDIVRRGKFDDTKQTMADHKPDSPSTIGTLVLCGISMGGNIVLRTAEMTSVYNKDDRMFFDALIALAPMTDLSSYAKTTAQKTMVNLSKVISVISPESTLGMEPYDKPTTINLFVRMQDPLYFKQRQCHRVAMSLFKATDTLRDNYSSFPMNLPVLVMHSTDDQIVHIKGTHDLVNIYLKDNKDLKFVEMPGSTHCLTSSIYVHSIMPYITKWLEEHVH